MSLTDQQDSDKLQKLSNDARGLSAELKDLDSDIKAARSRGRRDTYLFAALAVVLTVVAVLSWFV